MKNLTEYITEAHDPFYLTTKISQYLCEVGGKDEVKEVLMKVADGLRMSLKTRKKLQSSETEANEYIESVYDEWLSVCEKL